MRLLYITNQISGAGGLERVLSIKASYLAEHYNYDIHIITLNQGNKELFYEFSTKIQYHDIKVNGNVIKYLTNYRNGISEVISKIDPNIISVCDDGLKGLLLPLFIGKPCPMIYERHVSRNVEILNNNLNVFKKKISNITFKLMNFGANKYDKFIVLTLGNLEEWPEVKNKSVIPNPISFYPEDRDKSTLNHKIVLAVGRHGYQKDYNSLLKIWKIVIENHSDWTLKIYGKKEKDEPLKAIVKELNIEKSVQFHDPIKNIQKEYKNASIYVMSSRFEGFGMVLIEAMAYGVPCISFNCPHGPSDIIDQKRTGFIIKPKDINDFAAKISELIKNEELRYEMGRKARLKAKDYLPEKVLPKWNALFENLLKNEK